MDEFNLDALVRKKIEHFKEMADWIPGIKIIQRIDNGFKNLYICNNGQEEFKITEAEFSRLSMSDYKEKFFDPNKKDTYLLELADSANENNQDRRIYLKRSRQQETSNFQNYFIQVSKFLPFKNDAPVLSLTQFIPVDFPRDIQIKIKRLLDEVEFKNKNHEKFKRLSKRHIEVLNLLARNERTKNISDKLSIANNTVESHKKKIRELLGSNKNHDLILYALAFDHIQFNSE